MCVCLCVCEGVCVRVCVYVTRWGWGGGDILESLCL